jgi:putative drug exporter of the RND superfamily
MRPDAAHRSERQHRNIAGTLARWSARHRATAILGWLAFVVVVTVAGSSIGTTMLKDSEIGSGDSRKAEQIIENAGFPDRVGELVLIQGEQGQTADDPDFRQAVADVAGAVEGTGGVKNIVSPYDPDSGGAISADRRSALVSFEMSGDPDTAADRVGPVLDAVKAVQADHPDLFIAETGLASIDAAIGDSLDEDFSRLGMLSIPLTLGILLVAFGALVAALLPVGLAITAIIGAIGLSAFASRLFPLTEETSHVMLLVGLAVGVDYVMFYLRREREERARGADPERALAIAAATSGRSVLISGLTVMAAMAGMFIAGNGIFTSFAVGTMLVVAVAVLGSLTVLPALLSKLGDRVDFGKLPLLYRRQSKGRLWSLVLTPALRFPKAAAVVTAGALIALAVPAFHLHTVLPGAEDIDHHNVPALQTYDRVQTAFPGGADPAAIVVHAADVTAPAVQAAIQDFRTAALATGEAFEPMVVHINPDQTVANINIGLAGNGTDAASRHAVDTLRSDVVPQTLGDLPNAEAYVGGWAAAALDVDRSMTGSMPLVFGFVLALAFVLVLVAFRSVVIAATTIVLNLLSVAAAYGLVVGMFQYGWGESLLGFTSNGSIASWLPIFLFVILFGLSMDYHVFVLSRIREAYDRGMRTRDAVGHGIRSTAGVITAAAVVMVAVFLLFTMMSLTSLKALGFGLAAAILIDATVVRGVLLPAVMSILGDRNWYLPRWLRWLPDVSHGEQPDRQAEPAERELVTAR